MLIREIKNVSLIEAVDGHEKFYFIMGTVYDEDEYEDVEIFVEYELYNGLNLLDYPIESIIEHDGRVFVPAETYSSSRTKSVCVETTTSPIEEFPVHTIIPMGVDIDFNSTTIRRTDIEIYDGTAPYKKVETDKAYEYRNDRDYVIIITDRGYKIPLFMAREGKVLKEHCEAYNKAIDDISLAKVLISNIREVYIDKNGISGYVEGDDAEYIKDTLHVSKAEFSTLDKRGASEAEDNIEKLKDSNEVVEVLCSGGPAKAGEPPHFPNYATPDEDGDEDNTTLGSVEPIYVIADGEGALIEARPDPFENMVVKVNGESIILSSVREFMLEGFVQKDHIRFSNLPEIAVGKAAKVDSITGVYDVRPLNSVVCGRQEAIISDGELIKVIRLLNKAGADIKYRELGIKMDDDAVNFIQNKFSKTT